MIYKYAYQFDDSSSTQTFSYDGGGLLEEAVLAETTTFYYDASGNPIRETDVKRNEDEPPDEPRIFTAK